ncbi:putative reverse transcriptase zinc-binding domain-containing protein [Helianthus debilis subsp. tardiflorus]
MRCSVSIEEKWPYWNTWVSAKFNLFTWRAALGRIPVKSELIKRGVTISNPLCSRCEAQVESVDHMCIDCTMSKSVWWNILAWVKLPVATNFGSSKETLEYAKGRKGFKDWKKVINLIFQSTLCHIWKARNEKEFNGIQVLT